MKSNWLSTVCPIAALYSCRILGLFLLIPVFTMFASSLQDATSFRIGLALGIYGLTQAIMQIPFGLCSDYFGRKPLINIGLIMLLVGSLIGAYSSSIWGIIIARCLQGAGAIGSALLALTGDLISFNDRAKAMAVVGVSIGVSFSLAMVLAPFITMFTGLSGIFYVTALLAVLGLIINLTLIPTPAVIVIQNGLSVKPFIQCLKNSTLLRLNIGILVQHASLTSLFFVLPLELKKFISAGNISASWQIYLPIITSAFILMAPIIYFAEKKQKLTLTLKTSVLIIAISQIILEYFSTSYYCFLIGLFLYFIAFNLLEAILPSQISKKADPAIKGTAMGIYSTFQFFGIFIGATLAGFIYNYADAAGVFYFNIGISLLWFIITLTKQDAI